MTFEILNILWPSSLMQLAAQFWAALKLEEPIMAAKTQPKRRISKSRIRGTRNRANSFIKREESLTRKVTALREEISGIEKSKDPFSSFSIRIKQNSLTALESELTKIQAISSGLEASLKSFTDKNNSLVK